MVRRHLAQQPLVAVVGDGRLLRVVGGQVDNGLVRRTRTGRADRTATPARGCVVRVGHEVSSPGLAARVRTAPDSPFGSFFTGRRPFGDVCAQTSHMTARLRTTGGAQGGRLLLAAGVFTLVNNYLPGSGHLDRVVLNAVALVAIALGLACLRVPWERLHPRAPLPLALVAFAMLSLSNHFGGVSAYSYAVYFVVVFVWIGIAQPPGTAWWLVPPAAAAYVLPFLVAADPPATALPSVTVAIPVCVLVAEVLARTVRRLEQSQDALRSRVQRVEQLARLAAEQHGEVVTQRAHEQAVVDVLADGVLVLDARGLVLSCNQVAVALLGTTPEVLVGTAPPLVVGADGEPVPAQVGARWIETVATRLAGTDERVVTMRDVSRQRALDEAKDLFLATTSHELRTPLTAVKGYVHMLQRRWEVLDEPTRIAALATIAERTEALVTLTNHLLLGARAGASRHSIARVRFDLPGAVATAAAAYMSISERHELRVDAGPEPLEVLGDPTSVEQVVGQLVENAVKYSPLGGLVEVRLRREGRLAVVEVADEGIGLPVGDELSLFAPFFQAGDINTREFGGVGLGLYIVRQLVEAQGGSVFARNRAEVGAVVGFTVPLAGAEPPSPRGPSDALAGGPSRTTL